MSSIKTRIAWAAIAALLLTAGTASAQRQPPFTVKFFGSPTIGVGGTTTIDITVNNPNGAGGDFTGVTFTDTFPAGIAVSTPNGLLSACTPGSTLGAITAVAATGTVSLATSTILAGGACTVQVNVTGTVPGAITNSVTAVDAVAGTGNTATAGITVLAIAPPTIAKAFGAPTIPLGGTTSLTITLTAAQALAGVSFTDTLPAGLTVAPNGQSTTCLPGAGVTATAGGHTVSATGLTFAAAGMCTVTVNVEGVTAGIQNNAVQAADIAAGVGNVATASVVVLMPPTLTKAFGAPIMNVNGVVAPTININGTSTLTFTVVNPNPGTALTGLAFTDTLPAGLVLSNPPAVISTCGGAITAVNNTNAFSLTGGALAAGATCNITVTVFGVNNGFFTNTTSTIASSGGTGLAATAPITVTSIIDPIEAFQVRYASNLDIGDSVVNLTNTGTLTLPTGLTTTGNLCVNVYTFDANEELISCCSCLVTPNGLNSLSAKTDLVSNTLTPGVPTSIVIKLVASRPLGLSPAGTGGTCNASSPTPLTVAPGMRAWGTTLHAMPTTPVTFGLTEDPFTPAPLSVAELRKLTLFCSFIQSNGSGFGICKSCRTGGLGASTH